MRASIYKILVGKANSSDPDQTASEEAVASDLGLHCLSRPFWQTISIQNFS